MPKQLKFMFAGDSNVGKTSIINTLIYEDENLLNKAEPTNNVDIFFKKMKIKDGTLLINVNFNL